MANVPRPYHATTTSNMKPIEIVSKLLQNTANPLVVKELVSPTATYVSLTYDHPNLKKIMPYAGRHDGEGPEAIVYTFATVAKIWSNEEFTVDAIFSGINQASHTPFSGSGFDVSAAQEGFVDVAVFGSFTYRSNTLGRAFRSPYNVWCKVDEAQGQVVYMQFMEDTLGTSDTFLTSGKRTYEVDPDTGAEFAIPRA